MTESLLELKDVSKVFSLPGHQKNIALNEVNLSIYKGETLGLVGESGCGKSTLARMIMGVYPPTSGHILFCGSRLKLRKQKERKQFAAQVQMVFQDPYTSLDPHMTVEALIGENLDIHGKTEKKDRRQQIISLLEMTGLSQEYMGRFPHEFSGGQRQRIGIARALAVNPKFVICDEPISALDLSIQSQIINLLMELKQTLGLTYLFISHDLNIVQYVSDRIAVMYAGKIVEIGEAKELYKKPVHPYTQMLLHSVLIPEPGKGRMEEGGALGEMTQVLEEQKGCVFADRCPKVTMHCRECVPKLQTIKMNHQAACHERE